MLNDTIFCVSLFQANDAGDHFPIVGFCLGNELLSALVLNENILAECDAQNLFLPLKMTEGTFSM